MDPEEAAEFATEGDAGASAEGHAAAEGVEMGGDEKPVWYRALRSTSPNPPIEDVGAFRDLQQNWGSYGLRGLQKLGGVDDTEAWVDLAKFAVGAVMAFVMAGDGEQGGEESETGADPGPDGMEFAYE